MIRARIKKKSTTGERLIYRLYRGYARLFPYLHDIHFECVRWIAKHKIKIKSDFDSRIEKYFSSNFDYVWGWGQWISQVAVNKRYIRKAKKTTNWPITPCNNELNSLIIFFHSSSVWERENYIYFHIRIDHLNTPTSSLYVDLTLSL